jgi:acyl-CoA synthetase (AMP-forming)/AMP-acid ligase II
MNHHAIHLGNAWEPPAENAGAWARRFGQPSGVEPGDRVLLVCERPTEAAMARPRLALSLNGISLVPIDPASARWEHEITPLLRERNELVVQAEPAAAPPAVDRHGRASLPEAWGRLCIVIKPR